MGIDWSVVGLGHIKEACALFDAGRETPRRYARSTFLLFEGKRYPGKFIRGLAYRVATGVELDPSVDYAGGRETITFYEKLDLTTEHTPESDEPTRETEPNKTPPAANSTPAIPTVAVVETQKQALLRLLRARFGQIETEGKFPWLQVPAAEAIDGTVAAIFHALKQMRGHENFATPGFSLQCDFVAPAERLIVEYDERQHFTLQRATALQHYGPECAHGFDRMEWIARCQAIHASDPTPVYRDEQRAFYDSIRDILAARNGYTLLRLKDGDVDWRSAEAVGQLEQVLATARMRKSVSPAPEPGPMSAPSVAHAGNTIRKVALVAHDYNQKNEQGLWDYSHDFHRINKACDETGCDTILYALHTWDTRSRETRTHASIFAPLRCVNRVILETGQWLGIGDAVEWTVEHVEVWERDPSSPRICHQCFAKSNQSASVKERFLAELPTRRVADGLLVICGESNIAGVTHGEQRDYSDPFEFNTRLDELGVKVVLNPIHDHMKRWEMPLKRRYYSSNGRTVLSVWNHGKKGESYLPWTVFRNDQDQTNLVQELETPIRERPDIRIGIVTIAPEQV